MDPLTWQLFTCFLRVAVASFGGGSSAIPLMQRELVGSALLTPQEFTEALALSTSLPGPVVSNMAVFVSYKLGGSHWTAAVAVVGAILPTALMMGGATYLLRKYQDLKALPFMLKAIQPLMVSLLIVTSVSIMPVGLTSVSQWTFFGATVVLMAGFNVHPGLIMLGAVAIGTILRLR